MKVLWITATIPPEVLALKKGSTSFRGSGGWIYSAANMLSRRGNIQLFVAVGDRNVQEVTLVEGKSIKYFLFPINNDCTLNAHKDKVVLKSMHEINERITPDIIHIHGTEHSLGLAYIKANGSQRVVVSIQGLISVIATYYQMGISTWEKWSALTLRDILFNSSISKEQILFKRRGDNELSLLKCVNHVIGRTQFDRIHTWAINPNRHYYFCNETLRDEFYNAEWIFDKCEKHTIFLSQANYPIKGLHLFLDALLIVKRKYPDVKVYIAGPDITRKNESYLRRIMIPGYWRLIIKKLKRLGLMDNVVFVGPLDASEMKERLIKANIFVCPSTIENSPNSLGEAQLVGVPCVASYVGGVPDFIPNNMCGEMYRCEEVEQLAYKICMLFESSSNFDNTMMRKVAAERHCQESNIDSLLAIYDKVLLS
ncbi:Glycosyltransferase involved in cell wall bisynthesis [Prevotellaceae bacterium MN60]|nr:Glycosyltransferase involved in cell wall bisynthesis [Prevotellaceae bacterium MN60]